jgi:hypothetical protein
LPKEWANLEEEYNRSIGQDYVPRTLEQLKAKFKETKRAYSIQLGQQTTGSGPIKNPFKDELEEIQQLEKIKFAMIESSQEKSSLELAREQKELLQRESAKRVTRRESAAGIQAEMRQCNDAIREVIALQKRRLDLKERIIALKEAEVAAKRHQPE